MHKRYMYVKAQGISPTLEEYKKDIDRMGRTIEECRAFITDRYHRGYDRVTAYFQQVLDVFEISKITCDCLVSEIHDRRKQDYLLQVWYQQINSEQWNLRYQVQGIVDQLKAEHRIQIERMQQNLETAEESLLKEQKFSSKLRAQLQYERHFFGNDYVVQAHERARAFEKSNSDLQNELEKYRNREVEMNAWIENIIQNRNELVAERDRDKQIIKTLEVKVEELDQKDVDQESYAKQLEHDDQKTIKALQQEIQDLKAKDNHDQMNRELQRKLENANKELKQAKTELDETKSRLSKLMSSKLQDDNPNIADLSDKNRPTKLAEKYTELYDNQWTDAFQQVTSNNEQETITNLREILRETMEFCQAEVEDQMERLKEALSGHKDGKLIPDVIYKQLKDIRKVMAEIYGKTMYKIYVDQLRASKTPRSTMALKVEPYLKECFYTCWLMCVQDPPVVLGPDVSSGSPFDTTAFKSYTQNGTLVDYVVWPALVLHKNGPVLCKGVAQGKDKKETRSLNDV